MGIGRELAGEGFRPLRVDLAYPPPPHAEEYGRIFGCPIRFGQLQNAFVCETRWYQMPIASADPFSHRQLLEFLAYSRLKSREAVEIIEQVERALRQDLAGRNTIADVAKELGMSERSLRRRLAESGMSFQALLDGLRKGRALELLGQSGHAGRTDCPCRGLYGPAQFSPCLPPLDGRYAQRHARRSGCGLAEIDP